MAAALAQAGGGQPEAARPNGSDSVAATKAWKHLPDYSECVGPKGEQINSSIDPADEWVSVVLGVRRGLVGGWRCPLSRSPAKAIKTNISLISS